MGYRQQRTPDMACPATVTVDGRGCVTAGSAGAEHLLGHPGEEVLGIPVISLIAEGAQDVADAVWGSPTDDARWCGKVVLRHRDADLVEVELVVHRGMTDDGDPEWLLVCVEASRCMLWT